MLTNRDIIVLPSGTFTGAPSSKPDMQGQTNYQPLSASGLTLFVNITARTTNTVTINIMERDPASASLFQIATTGALAANGLFRVCVAPGVIAQALSGNDIEINRKITAPFIIQFVHGDLTPISYSVGMILHAGSH